MSSSVRRPAFARPSVLTIRDVASPQVRASRMSAAKNKSGRTQLAPSIVSETLRGRYVHTCNVCTKIAAISSSGEAVSGDGHQQHDGAVVAARAPFVTSRPGLLFADINFNGAQMRRTMTPRKHEMHPRCIAAGLLGLPRYPLITATNAACP